MTELHDNGSGHDDDHAGNSGLTPEEIAILRRAKIARTAARSVTQDDLLAELPRLTPAEAAYVHRGMRMRANAPQPTVARSVRMMLAKADEDTAGHILHDCFHYGVVIASETADLEDDELAALLSGDLDVLDPTDLLYLALRDEDQFGLTPTIRAATWAGMVSRGHPGDVAALAWLVADPPACWGVTQQQAAADAWASVRERIPALPEKPLPLAELVEIAVEMAEDDSAGDGPGGSMDKLESTLEEVTGEPTSSFLDLEDLRALADELEQRQQNLEEAAVPALARTIAEGRVLIHEEFQQFALYASQLLTFLDAVAAATGQPQPATLAAAGDLVDAALAASSTGNLLERVRRLSTLQAPAFVAEDAQRVVELAAGAGPDTPVETLAGLDALVTLIELGGSDPEQATELGRAVSAALPGAVSLLMLTSTPGVLRLADEAPASPAAETETEPEPATGAGTDETDTATDARTDETDAEAAADIQPDEAPVPEVADLAPPDVSPADGEPATEPSLEDALAGLDLTLPATTPTRRPGLRHAAAPEPAAEPTPAQPATDPADLYGRLLGARQFSLAYWLTVAEDTSPAVQAAHRLAAHASALKTSTGSNAAAFAAAVGQLDADELRDHLGTQMLVYAAAVRAGLLSPTAGAAGPLRDIATSIVRSGEAVGELTEELLAAIYSGAYLTPRSADAVAEAAEADSELEALAAAAANLLATASSRNIRYQGATDLWQEWMGTDGYLGAPLAAVAAGAPEPGQLILVRDRVAELRDRQQLEAMIDRGTARQRGHRNRRIEARARDKLIEWAGDVAELLSSWITAMEDLARPAHGTWMADPMADLRAKVGATRDRALAELAALSDSGRPGRAAALSAGLAMLTDALDLLAGTETIEGAEVPSDRVLGGRLALAPDLLLDSGLQPLRQVTCDDVAAAYDAVVAGAAGWRTAFEQRAARHDHVGTQLIIEALRGSDPALAQQLAGARDQAVDESTGLLDDAVAALARRIDADRLSGQLSDDDWTDLSSRARAHQPGMRGTRRDFDGMLADLAGIEADRVAATRSAIDAYRAGLDISDLPADAVERILGRVDDGDLTTAAEYVETLRSGKELPGPSEAVDHLQRFYPTFPAVFAPAPSAPGLHPLATLQTLLANGDTAPLAPLAAALAAAGLDLAAVPRAKTAAARLEQWALLSGARTLDARIGNVKAVLEQAGFLFDKSITPPAPRGRSGRGAWLDLSGVSATAGKALIPAFGSGMSPSGNSLRLLAVWRSPRPQELVEMLRTEPSDQSVIVLYFGTLDVADRRELARLFRSGRKLPPTAVLDDAAFAYLACQPAPGRDVTMAITLPFTSATPFTPDVAGLVPPEMFYGRTEERDKVIDMMGPCLVYGGRQLGKSALLCAAAREFGNRRAGEAIYEPITQVGKAFPIDAVWTTLWPKLAGKQIVPETIPDDGVDTALVGHVADWIAARPGRQLLLLLDESDSFLDGDAEKGFPHVTRFKTLMERTHRKVKVVFAGLHQTARFERLANHPLAHFGDPVCVGPLAPQPAYNLLTNPLHTLGYRFTDRDHAARVLALTNNQPALIQLFGRQVLDNLRAASMPDTAPPQFITREDIERVWADPGLRSSFRKKFDLTLNLDPHYKVIAYSVAFYAHADGIDTAMTPTQLRDECEQWWPTGFAAEDIRTGEFRALLDECVDLGVLSRTGRGYRLRTPNVLDLLGTREEVEEFLERAESSLELPESFDGSLMRPMFAGGRTQGPLTSAQLADLLATRNQVRLIAGSPALTVQRCLKALQDENEHAVGERRKAVLRDASITTLVNTAQQATLHAAGKHAIVVADLRDARPDAAGDAWRQARALIAEHYGGTLGIVLISTPAQAALWPAAARQSDTSSGLTELRRYDTTDLRLWLTETPLPFQDADSRNELLAATGGWPVLVNRVAEDLSARHEVSTPADPLAGLRTHLTDPGHAAGLVTASGARADAVLSASWDFLVQIVDAPADLQTIADYLDLHAASGDPGADALAPDSLTGAGYRSTGDVVEVLRTLGLLAAAGGDGLFQVEPVMAAATRLEHG